MSLICEIQYKQRYDFVTSMTSCEVRMEQKFALFLEPGKYCWMFDTAGMKPGQRYLTRVFFDKKLYDFSEFF